MIVFLSWSGSRSKKIADKLGEYIQQIVQAVEPWISSDISKGLNWVKETGNKLEEINFGIICLTRENLNEKWILFEAGALSKKQGSHVCTFLYDLKPTDIEPPLALYQHTIFEREDVRKLLHTIHNETRKLGESKMPNDQLDKTFDRYWPDLEKDLKKIVEASVERGLPIRSEREILEEILEIVRTRRQIYPQGFIGMGHSGAVAGFEPYGGSLYGYGDTTAFSILQPSGSVVLEDEEQHAKRLLRLVSERSTAYKEKFIYTALRELDPTIIRSTLEKLCNAGHIRKEKTPNETFYYITDSGRDYLDIHE